MRSIVIDYVYPRFRFLHYKFNQLLKVYWLSHTHTQTHTHIHTHTHTHTHIYIYIYNSWNIDCDPGFHGVFCKTTIIRQFGYFAKNSTKPRVTVYIPWIKYLLLYDSSIVDIEHSPYYIALSWTHTHKVI